MPGRPKGLGLRRYYAASAGNAALGEGLAAKTFREYRAQNGSDHHEDEHRVEPGLVD
jgi:hypothetical protein